MCYSQSRLAPCPTLNLLPRLQLWGLCLEMVDVAGYSDPSYVRQLWDVHLKAAVDAAAKRSGGGSDRQSDGEEADTTPGLEAAAAEVACLGERFYPSPARCAILRA